MSLRTAFLWIMVASLSLAAAIGIVAILSPTFGQTQERVLITSLLVGAFSITALACATVLGRRRLVGVMWLGIGASAAALLLWLIVVWFDVEGWNEPFGGLTFKIGFTVTIVTIWSAHLGLLWMPRLDRPAAKIVRWATAAVAGILALAILSLVVWLEFDNESVGKLIGVLAILASCGTVVTPVLGLIEWVGRRGHVESIAGQVKVVLTCPRCGTSQVMAAGAGRCQSCGLRIAVEVEEPRCACGYQLFQLRGDRCPECGREIPQADRWAARAVPTDAAGPYV